MSESIQSSLSAQEGMDISSLRMSLGGSEQLLKTVTASAGISNINVSSNTNINAHAISGLGSPSSELFTQEPFKDFAVKRF